MEFKVSTECGHCGAPLHLEIDSELNYQVGEQEAQPLIYVPFVDFQKIDDPSIIDQF